MLKVGTKAPLFELEGSDGNKLSLDSLKDRFAVIVFYPKNNTGG